METTKSKISLIVKFIAIIALTIGCFFVFSACDDKEKIPENAITISNYQELKTFLDTYASDDRIVSEVQDDKFVLLTADIDCGGEVLTPLLTQDDHGLDFKFDGGGHTISNFKLNETSIRSVSTSPGTNQGVFNVLALFPRSEGGEICDIEFKDVTIDLTNYDMSSSQYAVQIGIVGYSKSSGAKENENSNVKTSTYKDIKITNMEVNVTSSTPSLANGFCFAIGSLIGLDADTTNYGENLAAEGDIAVRDNIKVTNFDVNVDLQGGPVLVGGVAGQVNWEHVNYTNCSVEGDFNIVNHGTDLGTYVKYGVGSIVATGGIFGGSLKPQYDIVVENCDVDMAYTITAGDDSLFNVGKFAGMIIESSSSDTDVSDVAFNENTGTATLVKTIGTGTASAEQAVELDYQTR